MAELSFALRLGLYLRIFGKQLMHHEALVGAHRVHLDVVLKEACTLRQEARIVTHTLHLRFMKAVYIYKKACRFYAVRMFRDAARYAVERTQVLAVGADEALRVGRGDRYYGAVAG